MKINHFFSLRTPVCWTAAILLSITAVAVADGSEKLRVIAETDAGGDPDDQATLVRFLLYTNHWDVEGIIVDRPRTKNWPLKQPGSGLDLVHRYLNAYGKVHKNLQKHSGDYPTAEFLSQRTVAGHNDTDTGVELIIKAGDRDDPRPIWYGNWGSNSGSRSNLRRALDKVKATRTPEEYAAFAGKFFICTLDSDQQTRQGHNELIPLYINTGPGVIDQGSWYHAFRPLTEKAGGFDVSRDIKKGHGPLGEIYTTPKEGDSWTVVYMIPTGLSDPQQPTGGGWGGRDGRREMPPAKAADGEADFWQDRYYWANARDTWEGTTSRNNTARRWAGHLQNDFKARLDWCVAPTFDQANHPPVPHVQHDSSGKVLEVSVPVGSDYQLVAEGSTDPDGDRLSARWYAYPEVGSYRGDLQIKNATQESATLQVPADAKGKTIHVILEMADNGQPSLTRYRRIIVTAK